MGHGWTGDLRRGVEQRLPHVDTGIPGDLQRAAAHASTFQDPLENNPPG